MMIVLMCLRLTWRLIESGTAAVAGRPVKLFRLAVGSCKRVLLVLVFKSGWSEELEEEILKYAEPEIAGSCLTDR